MLTQRRGHARARVCGKYATEPVSQVIQAESGWPQFPPDGLSGETCPYSC